MLFPQRMKATFCLQRINHCHNLEYSLRRLLEFKESIKVWFPQIIMISKESVTISTLRRWATSKVEMGSLLQKKRMNKFSRVMTRDLINSQWSLIWCNRKQRDHLRSKRLIFKLKTPRSRMMSWPRKGGLGLVGKGRPLRMFHRLPKKFIIDEEP